VKRGLPLLVLLFLAVGAGLWWSRPWEDSAATDASVESVGPSANDPRLEPRVSSAMLAAREEARRRYRLNEPETTIQHDLQTLMETFAQWQTNFSATGNPVGTNAEITAALTGDNPLRLDVVPRAHPAINARGELCDRWGTPFRFHQQSGRVMEIISAGPDRDFATADDARSQ
jgi:hypothetical protein